VQSLSSVQLASPIATHVPLDAQIWSSPQSELITQEPSLLPELSVTHAEIITPDANTTAKTAVHKILEVRRSIELLLVARLQSRR
jgi:hypothetical protein